MRHVIDTGVLFHPKAVLELAEREDDIVLPAVAYAERVRQLRRTGRSIEEFDSWLAEFSITIEPFGTQEALRLTSSLGWEMWRRHARDALIAAHVRSDDVIWTTNWKDFETVGISTLSIRRVVQST